MDTATQPRDTRSLRSVMVTGVMAGAVVLSTLGAGGHGASVLSAAADTRVVTGYPVPAGAEKRDPTRLVELTVTIPSLAHVANPVAGYEVTVTSVEDDPGTGEPVSYTVVTGAGGHAVFPDLTHGLWTVQVQEPDGEQEFQSMTADLPLMTMDGRWWYAPELILKPQDPKAPPVTSTPPPSSPPTTTTPVTEPPTTPQTGDPEEPGPVRESLPVTGVQLGALLAIIAALLAAGVGLLLGKRRRSGDDETSDIDTTQTPESTDETAQPTEGDSR